MDLSNPLVRAVALTTLIPFTVAWGARSTSGAWKITTNANVSVVAFGSFT